ncbi:hypothetical protein B0H12DRAFT_122332 [Mycena haematopus]|nr:hypothetical protein B0H12DRAFT_122332 [Mycena haematopus]
MPDVDPDQQVVADALEDLLAWNPPKLTQFHDDGFPSQELTMPPHAFYNKHIDARLSLDHVISMPTLVTDLASAVSEYSTDVLNRGLYGKELPPVTEYVLREHFVGAGDVANFYSKSTAEFSAAVTTKLLLIPTLPTWEMCLYWSGVRAHHDPTPVDETASLWFATTEGKPGFGEAAKFIAGDMLDDVQKAVTFAPQMGTWIFLTVSPESETLLVDLGRACSRATFPYNRCRTRRFPPTSTSRPVPRDASSSPWSIPSLAKPGVPHAPAGPKRSTRLKNAATSSTKARVRMEEVPRVAPPASSRSKKSTARTSSKITAEALLQLGWARAVENDSTLIIFNCGNYERIGVRYRETRTLYLSDLIDVTSCKDPGYVKIHAGVFMSLTLDAICRAKDAERVLEHPQTSPRRSSRKRSGTETRIEPENKSKRRKTVSEPDPEETASKLVGQRNLMLLHLDYDFYHSPVPASYIRSTPFLVSIELPSPPRVKRAYQEHEYFNVILTSKLGYGATGVAHGGIFRAVVDRGGKTLERNVVVKFAILKDQQRRLRREYEVYRHLAARGVGGIPEVYGIFDDLEGGPVALVMSHSGKTLVKLMREHGDQLESILTTAQRDRFIAILQGIHDAGVRHCDIRLDNLMVSENGEPGIIDFDRASFNAVARKKQTEMNIMKETLRDKFCEYYDLTVSTDLSETDFHSEDWE